uniref:Uncharacterized protein n=1 Tax=Siphoviridae sp. ct5wd11 TaxID=2827781 RepID=A0A8S5SR59_9CAUD|nr:MAG TPA: hypothetical protein [Siphoviridae sp. ct5wd11]
MYNDFIIIFFIVNTFFKTRITINFKLFYFTINVIIYLNFSVISDILKFF